MELPDDCSLTASVQVLTQILVPPCCRCFQVSPPSGWWSGGGRLTCSPVHQCTPSGGAGCPGPTACCGFSGGPSSGRAPPPAGRAWLSGAGLLEVRAALKTHLGEREAVGQGDPLLRQQLLLLLGQLELQEQQRESGSEQVRRRPQTGSLTACPSGLGGYAEVTRPGPATGINGQESDSIS